MPRTTWAAGAAAAVLITLAGCADNPTVLKGRVAQYQQQQSALQKQNELYQSRIDTLDRDNQQPLCHIRSILHDDRITTTTPTTRAPPSPPTTSMPGATSDSRTS